MSLTDKARNIFRALLQTHGSMSIKRLLWNTEFARGEWNNLQNTSGDRVYSYIEKYSNRGTILDLGCGLGSTGNELDAACYEDYTGVDISDVAVRKAEIRSELNGRENKNHYFQSDIYSYVPKQQFDAILFRDSIYYVPQADIAPMLERYSKYLKKSGVFIVRMWSMGGKYKAIMNIIESAFEIVAKNTYGQSEGVVIIFRRRSNP